ncbi:MAG: hypothetical protein HY868_27585 [Chloroflexi bacterium]|nr:hypothetical protein [Chloroflexota bacterium]
MFISWIYQETAYSDNYVETSQGTLVYANNRYLVRANKPTPRANEPVIELDGITRLAASSSLITSNETCTNYGLPTNMFGDLMTWGPVQLTIGVILAVFVVVYLAHIITRATSHTRKPRFAFPSVSSA